MIFSNYCYITSPHLFKKNEPDTKQRDQFNFIYENEDCAGKKRIYSHEYKSYYYSLKCTFYSNQKVNKGRSAHMDIKSSLKTNQ